MQKEPAEGATSVLFTEFHLGLFQDGFDSGVGLRTTQKSCDLVPSQRDRKAELVKELNSSRNFPGSVTSAGIIVVHAHQWSVQVLVISYLVVIQVNST